MDVAPPSPPRPPLIWLALLLALALGLRLLPVLCHGAHPALFMGYDSWGYHRLATNLLAGHGYSWDTAPPYTPNLYRPPGYPVLLLGLYALTGPSILAAIALQALAGTAAVLLTFVLARGLDYPPRVALLAAAVQALDPVAIQYSNLMHTEVYTSLILLLTAVCVCRYRRSARAGWLLAAGALLAAGILVHPVLLFLPLLLLAAPLLTAATRTPRQLGAALTAVVLALAPASAWVGRNWYVGGLAGLSSVSDVNLLKYKAAGVEAELRGTTREVERDRLARECEAELPPGATPGERYRLWEKRGTAILLAHPLTYAKVHVRGMLVELFGPERDHTTRLLYGSATLDQSGTYTDASIAAARTERPVPAVEAGRYLILGWQVVLAVGLLLGTWHALRRRRWLLVALLVVPLYVLTLSGGPEGSPRFRTIYLPALSILTGVGAHAVLSRRTARRAVVLSTADLIRAPRKGVASRKVVRPAQGASDRETVAPPEHKVAA
jgi:4-amino-4-deoxy-L-arabinose transferase-like glycosyltransferase